MPNYDEGLARSVYLALRGNERVGGDVSDLLVAVEGNSLVLEGLVRTIAARRLLPRSAREMARGFKVHDYLRLEVSPVFRRADDELRVAVLDSLEHDPMFSAYQLMPGEIANDDTVFDKVIRVSAWNGTVRLTGTVSCQEHRHFAEVLSWWVPGCSDVDNCLYVSPSASDTDLELTRTVRLALDRDPWVDARHLQVETKDRVVHLTGMAPGLAQKSMAERDAWYVSGVDDVVNRIEPGERRRLRNLVDAARWGRRRTDSRCDA